MVSWLAGWSVGRSVSRLVKAGWDGKASEVSRAVVVERGEKMGLVCRRKRKPKRKRKREKERKRSLGELKKRKCLK